MFVLQILIGVRLFQKFLAIYFYTHKQWKDNFLQELFLPGNKEAINFPFFLVPLAFHTPFGTEFQMDILHFKNHRSHFKENYNGGQVNYKEGHCGKEKRGQSLSSPSRPDFNASRKPQPLT